jgi:hypothetical protein
MHYLRGKADWMTRGLPCEPVPPVVDRLHALPYFINNLFPGLRDQWISLSRRSTVAEQTKNDFAHLAPSNPVPPGGERGQPFAVVLNPAGILLGVIEGNSHGARAIDAIDPSPQTIRPDMTHRLAADLLRRHRYLLVTNCYGKYIGRYHAPAD